MKFLGKIFGHSKRSDYSDVIHVEIARQLVETGELIDINPMPVDFGGVAGPLNTIYVPPSAEEKFNKIIERLHLLANAGEIDRLRVEQAHRGASIVPTRLYFAASLGDQDAIFHLKIEVW